MKIAPFATEHFYARYEFNTPYQLCNSDCETVTIGELLELAGVDTAVLTDLPLGYTESQGNPRLRAAIAATYKNVQPDEVIVLGTPVEGIYLAARALLAPEDEVIVLTPAYDALINLFEHIVGAERVKKWAFTATENGWQLDFAQLHDLLTPRTRLLVVNFPHNPTGYLPAPHQLADLTAVAAAHNLWLFSDEMYHGLINAGTPPVPSLADTYARTVTLSGLSKTAGLPGLRTGWLAIGDETLRQNVMNWKFYTSICPPAPSERLAEIALSIYPQLLARSRTQIAQNLELAAAFFARWSALFTWQRPLAGSTALVRMNVPSVSRFAAACAAEAGVLIHPATTLGGDDHHMRLGLGRAGFGPALQQFEAYLRKQKLAS